MSYGGARDAPSSGPAARLLPPGGPIPPPRLRYQTFELGDLDIHIRGLRDRNQYRDDPSEPDTPGISSATWSLSGVVWPAAVELAHRMTTIDLEGRRFLEVGCALGLASLVLHVRGADIHATDHHPQVSDWLAYNVTLNGGGSLPFTRADWTDEGIDLGRFDRIIGSDVLYEPRMVPALAGFIARHARADAQVIIADPGRSYRGRFETAMAAHGFDHRREPWTQPHEGSGKGQVLVLERHSSG